MSGDLSRRELLRAAGGLTFLGLLPVRNGVFALADWAPSAPLLFTAVPYVQPGPASGPLVDGRESVVVAWQTEQRPAEFIVEYGATAKYGARATIAVTTRSGAKEKEGEGRINYAATLTGLRLGARFHYRVRLAHGDQSIIADGYGTARKPRGASMRFVAFGDNSYGEIGQRQIAYWAYRARPDFVMNTGDNVYDSGRDDEYQRYFFPVYNADIASPGVGAPLLRSVPFYTVLANHDVHGKDANGHPAADFDLNADALGYFTNMYLPLNGPAAPPQPMPTSGAPARVQEFARCAGARFPRMGNYSFDYGDAHFLCLDSNTYVDPTDPGWRSYIDADLGTTDARWKFVVYHHPAFNVGQEHYTEQHMRVLSPIFEAHHVDFVLSGHEHNYQRTRPLRFVPAGAGRAPDTGQKDRRVPGTFHVDERFDGRSAVRPDGVQYITTGAGGRHLYDPTFTDAPDTWLREDDGRAAYVARVISDRHSFTMFDIDGPRLTMTQVDQWGHEVDRVHVSKEITRLTSS